MAKLSRESRLRERRVEKEARKRARRAAAAHPSNEPDAIVSEGHVLVDSDSQDSVSQAQGASETVA